jgi:hypothetical protein
MLRFSIRDVLWLTLVLAVALAWFNSDRNRESELRATVDRHNKWLDEWKLETAETIEGYRKAALDPVAYREFVYKRNQEVAEAKKAAVVPSDEND